MIMQNETYELIDKAVNGDKKALQSLIVSVQDLVYNLSLRMLGSPHDAEDATQEIMIKIMTQLSTFRKESAFSTWVYRIATNYLINCKKTMFAHQPLSFEFYAQDINAGFIPNIETLMEDVDEGILAQELKSSCTNVMLQCLDPDSRCIYILGIMFKADSKVCGEILGITAEAYRQRLSRIRKKVAEFLSEYCGLSKTGKCNCHKRVGYAIQTNRLNPKNLEYSALEELPNNETFGFIQSMEEMDELSLVFANLPKYHAPQEAKNFLEKILTSGSMSIIKMEV
jgi:RNA polymerase sigma factor (sigma-70 family)